MNMYVGSPSNAPNRKLGATHARTTVEVNRATVAGTCKFKIPYPCKLLRSGASKWAFGQSQKDCSHEQGRREDPDFRSFTRRLTGLYLRMSHALPGCCGGRLVRTVSDRRGQTYVHVHGNLSRNLETELWPSSTHY